MEDDMSKNMHEKHTQQVGVHGMARVDDWDLKLEAYAEIVL